MSGARLSLGRQADLKRIYCRWAATVALVAIFAAGALALWPRAWTAYEALLLFGDLVEHPLPAAIDLRPAARRLVAEFAVNGRVHRGDYYQPEGVSRAGIVFIPGAVETGKDDRRVVAFATALARARFSVLVPDVVALRQLRLLPETARDVADALSWMLAGPERAPQGRLGVITTSVAIGPALIALLDPPLSESVDFFVSIGGYHDLPRTLAYLTTGHYEAHGVSLRHAPKEYGKWVYALSNAPRLDDASERQAFEALARRKLRDPEAHVGTELAHLGPTGHAIHDFIVNTDPARSSLLLERFPDRLRADVAALDLSARDLQVIKARFILVHGLDDDLIPYGESIGLATALALGQARVFLLGGLLHVDIAPQFADGWRMWCALHAMLGERAP